MKRIGVVVMLAAFVALSGLSTSNAAGSWNGCYVLAADAIHAPCEYTAKGPGTYYAAAPTGWRIERYDPETHVDCDAVTQTCKVIPPGWRPVVIQQQTRCDTFTPYYSAVITGNYDVAAGDRIRVSSYGSCWDKTYKPTPVIIKSPFSATVTVPPTPVHAGYPGYHWVGFIAAGDPIM